MRIMILNGPNLNLLGVRNPAVYGRQSYQELVDFLLQEAASLDLELTVRQSQYEGDLIESLHEAHARDYDGVLLNAGAYTHYAYALHDAIEAINVPVIEVHLSDLSKREELWRQKSVLTSVCAARFMGEGFGSYKAALDYCKKTFSTAKKG